MGKDKKDGNGDQEDVTPEEAVQDEAEIEILRALWEIENGG